MQLNINRKVAFLSSTLRQRSQNIVVTHPSTPHFCRHFLKLLSPTLPKLMNWILFSLPPLSSDPDTPQKSETCTYLKHFTWYEIIIIIIIIIIIGVLEVRRVFLRSWLSLGNSSYNAIPGDYHSPYYH